MAKTSTKALHALIDELADAGKADMLTALHTILMGVATAAEGDGDLNLDLDDDEGDSKSAGKKSKRRGGKSKDADEDDGDGEDDLDLGDLEVEDEDDDSDDDDEDDKKSSKKSGKKVRGKKAKADDDDDDAGDGEDGGDAPELEDADGWETFLDECDEHVFEPAEGRLRELQQRLSNEFDFDVSTMEKPWSKKEEAKMDTREKRVKNTELYGQTLAKFLHITGQLVEAGDSVIEEVAEAEEIDLDGVKGKGKTKTLNMAMAIVAATYGGEPEEDESDDE